MSSKLSFRKWTLKIFENFLEKLCNGVTFQYIASLQKQPSALCVFKIPEIHNVYCGIPFEEAGANRFTKE